MIAKSLRHAVIGVAFASAAALGAIDAAQASLLTWNFGGGSSSLSGPYGNSRTFTADDGITTVIVSAWALTANSNTRFEDAYLGHYSSGLGVTNRAEGSGGNASHTMDNVTHFDVIAFLFSSVIEPTSAFLTAFSASDVSGDPDSDISAWIGDSAGPVNLAGMTIANLDSTYGPRINNTAGMLFSRTANFGNGSSGNLLLMSAQASEYLNSTGEDLIKVKKISGNTVQVLEPSSLMVFAVGLLGLGMAVRRRRNNAGLA